MSAKQLGQRLYYVPKPSRWSSGVGAKLPEEYRKFWREWKLQQPSAVHYIKQEGTYVRDETTEQVRRVQNIPLPLKYPREFHEGIWGGEAIIQGFTKKHRYAPKAPRFWFPQLFKNVVYSEVLDKYMNTVVTQRTIHLIHEHYGFDHYILKTPACDLRSELALKIKRATLIALADKTLYPDDPVKKEDIYKKYEHYLEAYTREEIEWYGLTFEEACRKWMDLERKQKEENIMPLKLKYRSELIEQLKQEEIIEVEKELAKTSKIWSLKNLFPGST